MTYDNNNHKRENLLERIITKINYQDSEEILSILRQHDLYEIPLDYYEYDGFIKDVKDILQSLEKKVQEKIYMRISKQFYVLQGVIESEAAILTYLENIFGSPFFKDKKRDFLYNDIYNARNYILNKQGHIIKLAIDSYESYKVDFFPKEICSLKHLKELYVKNQNIKVLPNCFSELKDLEKLDLSYNPIEELPEVIKRLKNLKFLRIENASRVVLTSNILNFIRFQDIEGKIVIEDLYNQIQNEINSVDLETLNREISTLYKIFKNSGENNKVEYPSKEILKSHNFMYIILWMLEKNKICTWLDITKIISQSTISTYLNRLLSYRYILKIEPGTYGISSLGKKRLKFLTQLYYNNNPKNPV